MRLVSQAFRSASADRDSSVDKLDYATPEKRGLEESIQSSRLASGSDLERRLSELAEKEELAEAAMRSAQQRLDVAAGEARQLSGNAEQCWQRVEQASRVLEARSEEVARDLKGSIEIRRQAADELATARQDLTAAYEFAAAAAEERVAAKRFYEKAARRAMLAVALSWLAMAWVIWIAFRTVVPVFIPALLTAGIVAWVVRTLSKESRG